MQEMLFEVSEPTKDPNLTALGKLKAKPLRAIDWYVEENGLTLKAAGAYPFFYFGTPDAREQAVHIDVILEDYDAMRDAAKRGKRAS